MADIQALLELLKTYLGDAIAHADIAHGELTLEIPKEQIKTVAKTLRDHEALQFDMLIDLCGVDYLHYGIDEWATDEATSTGFERAFTPISEVTKNPHWSKPRFAVVYHLLSVTKNWRLRVKVFLTEDAPIVDTVIDVWQSADWYEREAFDLYGILFNQHPDLRRILTDYGFIGHPFRKDFPLIGEVAMRYDAHHGRVVYEPVDIEARTLVPKTIRKEQEGEQA